MAYENVDVNQLNQAFNKIGEITCKNVTSLKHSLDDKSKWDSIGRKKIIKALEELEKEYSSLLKDVNKFKKVTSYIEEYKTLDDEIGRYKGNISIQKKVSNSLTENDDEAKDVVDKKIAKYSRYIENNNQRKQEIVNKVQNIID